MKELSRLKLYLADLPTKEEHTEAKNKLTQTQSELATSKEHIDNLVDERSKLQRSVLIARLEILLHVYKKEKACES